MALTAHAEPNTTIVYGDHVFQFGEDGSRQVSQAEADVLNRYADNGGPAKVEIRETKSKSGGK